MISVYQAFKLILGLIISGFVLYFLVYYAGTYGVIQQETQQAKTLRNFNQLAQDIHYSGNPYTFDFYPATFEVFEFDPTLPAGLRTDLGKIQFLVPTLLRPGQELFLDRKELELGWWDFRVVEAMPESRILFTPQVTSQQAIELIQNMTNFLPNSLGFEPRVTFGFCDGTELYYRFCFNQTCDATTFLTFLTEQVRPGGEVFDTCIATLNPNDILITIDTTCFTARGLCVELPENGVGRVQLAGSTKDYWYKDSLDLAALIIGGTEAQLYGIAGESLWKYKNQAFGEEIGFAAEMMAGRAGLLGDITCRNEFGEFSSALGAVSRVLKTPNYWEDKTTSQSLVDALGQAWAAYQALLNKGCDYVV